MVKVRCDGRWSVIWFWAEMTRNQINPSTKKNGVGRCRGGTLDVGLFILEYKVLFFSGDRRVQDFCFMCFVNGH